MKKITCNKCAGIWYVETESLDSVCTCPYCALPIREKQTLSDADSLDKAIYLAIAGLGDNALVSPTRIGGYISDIAPSLKKELRVLTHSFREEYFSIVRSAFSHDLKTAEKEIGKLVRLLIDEDGLSESWAKQIGSSYLGAIKLVQGIGLEEILLADVVEFEVLESVEHFDLERLSPEQLEELRSAALGASQTDYSSLKNSVAIVDPEPMIPPFPDWFVVDGTKLVRYTGESPSVIIPEGITSIEHHAFYCNDLITDVQIPSTVRSIGKEAFSHCSKLYSVVFEEGIREIQEAAFAHCTRIRELILPDSICDLGPSCFYWCISLKSLRLPLRLFEIPENAFYECDALGSVVIPPRVHSLRRNAFPGKTNLIYQE